MLASAVGFGLAHLAAARGADVAPTGQWRTYHDPEGYFSVEYPATWQAKGNDQVGYIGPNQTGVRNSLGGARFTAPVAGFGGYDFTIGVMPLEYRPYLAEFRVSCWWRAQDQVPTDINAMLRMPGENYFTDGYHIFSIGDRLPYWGLGQLLWPPDAPPPTPSPEALRSLRLTLEHAFATFTPDPGRPHAC